jgi:hypothetical protein
MYTSAAATPVDEGDRRDARSSTLSAANIDDDVGGQRELLLFGQLVTVGRAAVPSTEADFPERRDGPFRVLERFVGGWLGG